MLDVLYNNLLYVPGINTEPQQNEKGTSKMPLSRQLVKRVSPHFLNLLWPILWYCRTWPLWGISGGNSGVIINEIDLLGHCREAVMADHTPSAPIWIMANLPPPQWSVETINFPKYGNICPQIIILTLTTCMQEYMSLICCYNHHT